MHMANIILFVLHRKELYFLLNTVSTSWNNGNSGQKIHAGHANMFLSSIFRDTLAGVTGATIELYDTDGSVGAAKGAGIGAGIYKDHNEAFATLDKLDVIEPNIAKRQEYADAYARWKYNINNDIITFK